jgi:hypothetical protein
MPFISNETIGTIRNKFAHFYAQQGEPIKDFASPAIKKLCDKLRLLEYLEKAEEQRKKVLGTSTGKRPSWMKGTSPLEVLKNPRMRYINTCGLCVSALSGRLNPKIIEIIWADKLP